MNVVATLRQECPLARNLSQAQIETLVDQSNVVDLAASATLFSSGDPADNVFIVLDGRLATLVSRDWGEERILEEAGVGQLAGTVELLNGDNRSADVRALADSQVLSIPRRVLEQLVGEHEDIWEQVSESARSGICRLLTSKHLSRLLGPSAMQISDPMLRLQAEQDWLNFERDILRDLEEHFDWLTLERGEYLFRQGDHAEDALVLVSGVLQVRIDTEEGGERIAAEVEAGEIVGEVALFTEQTRTASLVAVRDCELFRLPRDVFSRISEKYPQILLNLYRSSFNRLVRNTSEPPWRPRNPNTALLRARANVRADDFIVQLLTSMQQLGSVGHFTGDSIDESLGQPGISQSGQDQAAHVRLVQWLNGQERHFGHIVYEADADRSPWTLRCVRQADHVLVIADAADPPDIPNLCEGPAVPGQRWSLVLLHPTNTDRPRGTAQWLDSSGIDSVYHVRRDNQEDIDRLARVLSGRAFALVLGGGAARGFAHLGVMRALEELEIPVDTVGGTSIGAALAGWAAQRLKSQECQAAATRVFSSLLDPTLPATALLNGKRITDAIFAEAETWDIEDFWLPSFFVSTNLTTATAVIHRRGNSARALRSSVSLPGILPPVPESGDLLVDGCVLNNLPIDVMRELNPSGVLIASDVVAPRGITTKQDYGLNVSGWRQVLGKFMPWMKTPRTPGVATVILQATMVGSERHRRRMLQQGLADFYQNTHVQGLGLLQFDALEKAAEIGYQASIEPLRKWKETGFQSGWAAEADAE